MLHIHTHLPHTIRRLAPALLLAVLLVFGAGAAHAAALTVAYSDDAPWSMKQNGAPTGIAVDILREAASRAGVDLSFTHATRKKCYSLLAKGAADLMLEIQQESGVDRFADLITPPYLTGRNHVVYALKKTADQYPRYEKLRWHYVAVQRGKKTFEPFATDRSIAKKRYNSLDTAFSRLLHRQVHAVATTEAEGGYWLATHQDEARRVARTGIRYKGYDPVYFAVSKKSEHQKAARSLGPAIISMIQDGSIEDIRARYTMGY